MGVLDDAIREHLDLKRRRGADPTEVERAEREALGPVRRGPEDAGEEALEDAGFAPDHEPGGQHDPEHGDLIAEPAPVASPEAPVLPVATLDATEILHEPLAAPQAAPGGGPEREAAIEPEAAFEPAVPAAPAPHPEAEDREAAAGDREPPRVGETAEYNVEEALDREPPEKAKGEDPLEETPEFLQDTPDHDRLWFEQRPPRDFNFDS